MAAHLGRPVSAPGTAMAAGRRQAAFRILDLAARVGLCSRAHEAPAPNTRRSPTRCQRGGFFRGRTEESARRAGAAVSPETRVRVARLLGNGRSRRVPGRGGFSSRPFEPIRARTRDDSRLPFPGTFRSADPIDPNEVALAAIRGLHELVQ
jgi:hypothetical protein